MVTPFFFFFCIQAWSLTTFAGESAGKWQQRSLKMSKPRLHFDRYRGGGWILPTGLVPTVGRQLIGMVILPSSSMPCPYIFAWWGAQVPHAGRGEAWGALLLDEAEQHVVRSGCS